MHVGGHLSCSTAAVGNNCCGRSAENIIGSSSSSSRGSAASSCSRAANCDPDQEQPVCGPAALGSFNLIRALAAAIAWGESVSMHIHVINNNSKSRDGSYC